VSRKRDVLNSCGDSAGNTDAREIGGRKRVSTASEPVLVGRQVAFLQGASQAAYACHVTRATKASPPMRTSTARRLRPFILAVVPLLLLSTPSVAAAQRHGRAVPVPRVYVRGGFYGPFYDPFFGPFYGPYYPGLYGPGVYARQEGGVRLKVRPRDASVYVDGYYAGIVDDFDGVFQSLELKPGGHHIEIKMPGYETLTADLHIQPGRTMTYHADLVPEKP
jgi:hypothetical protein